MVFHVEIDFLKDYLKAKEEIGKNIFLNGESNYEKLSRFNKSFFSRKISYPNLPNIHPEELKEYLFRKSDSDLTSLTAQFRNIEKDAGPFYYHFVSNTIDTKSLRKETKTSAYKLNDILNDTINAKLFIPAPYNIRDDLKSWGSISEKTVAFEFLVINDSFLFLNDKNALVKMLTALNSKFIGSCKYVIINTATESFDFPKRITTAQEAAILIERIGDKFSEIQQSFPDIKLLLTVNKYHKRLFFTNCQYFASDNSFSNYFIPNEELRCLPHLSFDETRKQLFFYTNLKYSKEVLNKSLKAKFFKGDQAIAKIILKLIEAVE